MQINIYRHKVLIKVFQISLFQKDLLTGKRPRLGPLPGGYSHKFQANPQKFHPPTQAFLGELVFRPSAQIRAPLNPPAWEATKIQERNLPTNHLTNILVGITVQF